MIFISKEKDLETGWRYYLHPSINAGSPLIVFLHGQGEIHSTNLDLVLRYGPLKLLKDGKPLGFDAHIVQPQLSSGNWNDSIKLHKFIWSIIERTGADYKRIHLMGVSLGGWGVWRYLASKYATELASAVLMSPGGGAGGKEKIIAEGNVPIWVAHAKNDPHTGARFSSSLTAVKRINDYAGKPLALLTHYGLTGHSTLGSWGKFMEPENFYLWDWIKLQKKS